MGIFRRTKSSLRSRANAAVDRHRDPAREIDHIIHDLEEQRGAALRELLSYKSSAALMEKDLSGLDEKIARWEKRAMMAVKAGDDAKARECLREKRHASEDRRRVERDRDEAASYALELNRSRKQVETKLRILKLKKGTLATQLAAARSGSGNVLGQSDELFEKLAEAEASIDEEAIMAEVNASLEGDLEAPNLEERTPAAAGVDSGLAELKARMAREKQQKG